jgi:hypothetical protein
LRRLRFVHLFPLFHRRAPDPTGWPVVGPEPVGLKTVGGRALRPGLLTSSPRRGMITT